MISKPIISVDLSKTVQPFQPLVVVLYSKDFKENKMFTNISDFDRHFKNNELTEIVKEPLYNGALVKTVNSLDDVESNDRIFIDNTVVVDNNLISLSLDKSVLVFDTFKNVMFLPTVKELKIKATF